MEYLLAIPFVLAYFLKGFTRIKINQIGISKSRTYNPGTHFILPFTDKLTVINTSDQKHDESVNATTKDGIICSIEIKTVYYVEEKNAEKFVKTGTGFIDDLIPSALEDIVGEIPYKELAEKREIITDYVLKKIDKKCKTYGMKVRSVDLGEIIPPAEIQSANALVVVKLREKEASKIEADAIKTKTEAKKKSDSEISEHKKKLLQEEAEAKIRSKEKVLKKEQEIAQVITESVNRELKNKQEELSKIYKTVERESIAKILQEDNDE